MVKHLHERRGITFNNLVILLGIREALNQGLLIGVPTWDKACTLAQQGQHVFNITSWKIRYSCGSVGCIGGYMALVSAGAFDYMGIDTKHPLHSLFYPPDSLNWSTITPAHAVKAIDNWLKTGTPRWSKIPGIKKLRNNE